MRAKHLCKRGSRYIYRCRVPFDLQPYFPSPLIWKNLKTDNEKDARVAAAAVEYRTQQLFLQLRTGMLPKDLQKRLVALYLNSYAMALKADATGAKFTGTPKDGTGVSGIFDQQAKGHIEWEKLKFTPRQTEPSADEILERTSQSDRWTGVFKSALPLKRQSPFAHFAVEQVSKRLEAKGFKMTERERDSLKLELTNADKQIYEVQSALLRGEWSPLELLQDKVAKELSTPYVDLETVLEKYREKYLADKPTVQPGTIKDMEAECRVLLEIFGNISIAEFNTLESVTKLKSVLRKYPLNKQQRYGERSIHSIVKHERGYTCISLKTANEYLKRAKAVADFARKNRKLTSANVYDGELFRTETAEEEQRDAYTNDDVRQLILAICTQPLSSYKPPKPERFWIILIALFHGLRLGNIVALTKKDICQTDRGVWVFKLRKGKTKSTVRPVAICDALLRLGFLEWVQGLPKEKLFQDTSDSFSKWYNRDEKRKDGYVIQGFETKYVTADKSKCLYSIRHNFAANVFDVTEDFKITADMMGHSTGKSVTARYTKRTKAETLKQVTEKMDLEHIDMDLLEARRIELFGKIT